LKSVGIFRSASLNLLQDRYLKNRPINVLLVHGLLTVHQWLKHYGTRNNRRSGA
jgi:hypothetical protein